MNADRPLLIWLAPILATLIGLLAFHARRQRVKAAASWSPTLGREAASSGRRSPLIIAAVALLAGLGLAGPRWGRVAQSAESRALNIALVMDVSKSMLAEDNTPNRLTASIMVARRLVQDLATDRLALIAFAARPYLLSPLTLDQSAISLQLDALDPTVASEGGSSLAAALKLAHEVLLGASEGGDRAVVVMTDGESFDGERELISAASSLKDDGITLVAIPFGTTDGALIPEGRGGFHRDEMGQDVVTRLNPEFLAEMTEAAKGVLVSVDAPNPSGDVRRALERLNRANVSDRMAADMVPRAWIFALAALLLLAFQAFTRRTAALMGIALCTLASPGSAQRPTKAFDLLKLGDTTKATEEFAAEAKRLNSDTAWYNAGSSALIAGDLESAVLALEKATLALDPRLRQRALYNLGTAQLISAQRDSTVRDSMLTAALMSLRQALELAPGDSAAKYNYELVRGLMPPPPPPQGGGGGGENKQQGDQPPPPSEPKDGMTQAEAEQVLNAMDRAERETRKEQARKQRRGNAGQGPDW